MRKLGSNEHRDEVIEDINKIHFCRIPKNCSIALCNYYLTKSGSKEYPTSADISNDIHKYYISGLNRCQTHRERLPFGAFDTELFSSLKEKSEKYIAKEITKSISINKDFWTKALQFNATNVHSVTLTVNILKNVCYIPSKISIDAWINPFEKTFDEFMDLMFSMWKCEFDHSDSGSLRFVRIRNGINVASANT